MPNELIKPSDFVIIAQHERIADVLNANIGGKLEYRDLDRLRVPAGGGITWTLETPSGPQAISELVGVIVGYQDCRAYWSEQFTGTRTPAQCVSLDGITGAGQPGGTCARCPLSQWGSSPSGAGQACKAMRRVLLVRPAEVLPIVVTLPPTSIADCRQYLRRLTSIIKPYWSVVSRATLRPEKSATGITYSRVHWDMIGELDERATEIFGALAQQCRGLLSAAPPDDDYKTE